MGNPLISVVTATYNARNPLEFTVSSVKNQTLACEHIVVDGGSSDGTADFLATQPVKFVSEPDRGIADAMNKGIAMATGDYILALHAGDTFLDVDSAAQATAFLTHDMASFDVVAGNRIMPAGPFSLKTEFFMTVPHQGLFVRRELFNELGVYDPSYKIAMDYEFILRAMRAGKAMRWVRKPLTYMDDTGISSRKDWPTLRRRIAENHRAKMAHAQSLPHRLTLAAFWAAYLPFKYVSR